jgi:hypothetical protein
MGIADGSVSTPGTNVVLRTCENEDAGNACNAFVEVDDDNGVANCDRFKIREGSATTVYGDAGPAAGGGGVTEPEEKGRRNPRTVGGAS